MGQAVTSTSLSASPASTTFGQVVTLTAQVAPSAPSTAGPLPSGTVTFAVDGQPVGAAVSLNGGQAQSQPITDLAPGPTELTATYSGDASYTGSLGNSSETVTCSQTLTSGGSGSLTVTSSTCVEGLPAPVTVRSGGDLALIGASVNGPITATGTARCSSAARPYKAPSP